MSAVLPIREVEKPWGRDSLPEPFVAPPGKRIGEIWFEPPPEMPELLVKYIFTSEALSVQVHPSDAETLAKGIGRRGKEECWLIVAAEPDAALGIGFKQPLSPEAMRAAAEDGSIERLMEWHKVKPGDFFYIPAGTVHAIGAGVSLIEVQQNSDITYRLYDYGRPRELHLEAGIAVAKGLPYSAEYKLTVPDREEVTLVEGPLFRLDQIMGLPTENVAARYGRGPLLVIPRKHDVRIGLETIAPGGCGLARHIDEVAFAEDGVCLIAQPLKA
jgi:mannose-6-phosphate isomerase